MKVRHYNGTSARHPDAARYVTADRIRSANTYARSAQPSGCMIKSLAPAPLAPGESSIHSPLHARLCTSAVHKPHTPCPQKVTRARSLSPLASPNPWEHAVRQGAERNCRLHRFVALPDLDQLRRARWRRGAGEMKRAPSRIESISEPDDVKCGCRGPFASKSSQ